MLFKDTTWISHAESPLLAWVRFFKALVFCAPP